MKRVNLEVRTHARATRILFEGRRAVGLRYLQGEVEREVRARREVILSAVPINSPHLLKLSGIGPGDEVAQHGIDVVLDRPGIGANLQDHTELYIQVACTQPITLFSYAGLAGRAYVGLRWLLRRDGLGATNHFETGGFIRSRGGLTHPDIQFHFLPLAVSYDGSALASEHGFQAHVGPMRSRSRGTLRLRSSDPAEPPAIRFNYMSHPDDWREFRTAVRLTRDEHVLGRHVSARGRDLLGVVGDHLRRRLAAAGVGERLR